jgi:heterodisulfide reductase subunit C
MVDDYLRSDDPEEVEPLKAVWARDYHVVFDPAPEITPERLEVGRELNEDNCAVCHSRPTAAFASLPLAILIKPAAATLNRIRADELLRHLHYLVCFVALALLPFTKFKHLLTTPLTLALRGAGTGKPALALNLKTRRALALDGCTHCGACSRVCSVAPSAQIIGNLAILPSEKLISLAQVSLYDLPVAHTEAFSEGSFICTECYRCTQICPSGLDLQDLWRASKASLTNQGLPDLHSRAVHTPADTLLPVMAAKGSSAAEEDTMDLCDDPTTFQACVQCAVCTSVCPVVAAATEPDQDPEIGPHLVTNLLRMQQMELALASRMVWACVTCYQCQEHCPQHIRVADLLYELRNRGWFRMKGALLSGVSTEEVQP